MQSCQDANPTGDGIERDRRSRTARQGASVSGSGKSWGRRLPGGGHQEGRLLLIGALFLPLFIGHGDAQPDPSPASTGQLIITATFEQIQENGATAKGGVLYFDPHGFWRLDYHWPIRQTLIANDSAAVVLYPDSKSAIRIDTPFLEPPSHLFFLAHARASYQDLAATGMRMVDFATRADSTVTTWVPLSCEDAQQDCGRVLLYRTRDHVVRLEAISPRGYRRVFRVTRFVETQQVSVPAEVVIEQSDGRSSSCETVRYFDVVVERIHPEIVFSTQVPAGYSIQERSW